jgi:hypothetical protein
MGQQQLLLLVLATVIVGLATVAGINAFEQNQKQSTADAMTQEALRIASDVQAHVLKPDQFGGGTALTDVTLDNLPQYSSDPYEGPNAKYTIASDGSGPSGITTGTFTAPSSIGCDGTNNVTAYNSDSDISVCVEISGTGSDDLETGVDIGS